MSTQHSALNPQHSALSTQPSALSTQHSALNPQHSALSTQPSALSTQHSALSTHLLFWIVLAAVCILFYGSFVLGYLPVGQDNSLMYCPFYSLHWDQGLPLWNPYSLSGSGLYDNLQAALLYPMRWPFYFLADWRSYFGIFNFLHYLVAFIGSALLLRTLGTARVSAVAGSVLFAAGGHLAGRIINPTIFYGCCWLPLLLYGAAGTRRRHGWAATFAMTMILTIGSPHVILYGLVGFSLVFLISALSPPPSTLSTQHSVLSTQHSALSSQHSALSTQHFLLSTPLVLSRVFHLLVALILAAPTLIPGIQRAGASIRTQAGAALNLSDSVDWSELAAIFPGGTPAGLHPEYIDKTCYVGSLAIALILFSLLCRASWRDRRFWCGWALVLTGVAFALGRNIGWQFVMPWIPGFRHLAGPSRALALSAAGAAILLALALESLPRRRIAPLGAVFLAVGALCFAAAASLAWRMPVAEGAPPFLDEWLRAWAVASRTVRGPLWLLMDSAAGLALGGLVLLLGARRPRFLVPGLTGLIILQLLHFLPRVAPPSELASFFDPPYQALFLRNAQDRELPPDSPFRIAGFDPLQLYDGDFEKALKKDFLTPNFATLYGLEDIQGFDPLIHLSYLDLIQRTSGRSPINDPIHNLDIARPDPALFDLLNVRFLIGHPYDRRLTNQSMRLTAQAPIQEVTAWNDAPTSTPLTDLLFVSLMDGPTLLQGVTAATLTVEAKEGIFSYPVRNGIETAHWLYLNGPAQLRERPLQVPIHRIWYADSVAPSVNYRVKLANYRGRVRFEKPLTVRKITWSLRDPRAVLFVACQAYRMARPPEAEDPWRLAWGRDEDPAPVFEYRNHKDRAVLVTEYKTDAGGRAEASGGVAGRERTARAVTVAEDTLRNASSSGVHWVERRTNTLSLVVKTPVPALLVLREMWDPAWKAMLDGKEKAVLPVNGLWRGVEVPAGTWVIELTFRPGLFYSLLWLSLATLAVASVRLIWIVFHTGLQKVYEEGED